jgi:DNA polymerase-3 subunit delta'
MHHCYLFEGPEGVGKATTALRLALYTNCLADQRPCGTCQSCRLMLAGTHPDLIVVEPDPEKVTRTITAEQARRLIAALQLQRHSARRRFVILDPADALGEEAANALLKTLEEPPAGTQFVLVTARAASLLQTVRSRSQRVRFGPVPDAAMEPWLRARGLDPALAVASQGSPGLALRLAEGEAADRTELAARIVETIGAPLHVLFSFTEATGKRGETAAERGATAERSALAVDALEELLRDTVAVAAGREGALFHPTHLARLRLWSAALYPGGVARLELAIARARERLDLNVNGRVVLEALFSSVNLELSAARAR